MAVGSRVAVVLVGVVAAVDGAVAELRQRDAAAVHTAQLPAGAGRGVRTGPHLVVFIRPRVTIVDGHGGRRPRLHHGLGAAVRFGNGQ